MTAAEARTLAQRITDRSQCSWGEAFDLAAYVLALPHDGPIYEPSTQVTGITSTQTKAP